MPLKPLLAAASLCALSTAAHAAVIDFNDPAIQSSVITSVSTTDGSITADVSATGGANQALVFDTTLGGTRDKDLQDPFRPFSGGPSTVRPGGVLIIQETAGGPPDDNASGGTLTFDFDRFVNFEAFKIFDGATITVSSTDTANVATFTVPEPPNEKMGNRVFGEFSIGGLFDNVSNLTFTLSGSGAIDDLQISAVPVPATLPLLLAGFGGFIWVGRRRQRTT